MCFDNRLSGLSNQNSQRIIKCSKAFSRNENSRYLKQVQELIEANKQKFTKPVYGPICQEISVKSAITAKFVEDILQDSLMNFIVQTDADAAILYKLAFSLNFKCSIVTIKDTRGPVAPIPGDQAKV